MKPELHSRFLLLTCASATVLAAGLVETPSEVKDEGSAGRITCVEFAKAEDGCTCLVGVEDVVTTQVNGQRTHAVEIEVLLHSDFRIEAAFSEAEVVVVTFGHPIGIKIHAEVMRQLNDIHP